MPTVLFTGTDYASQWNKIEHMWDGSPCMVRSKWTSLSKGSGLGLGLGIPVCWGKGAGGGAGVGGPQMSLWEEVQVVVTDTQSQLKTLLFSQYLWRAVIRFNHVPYFPLVRQIDLSKSIVAT